MLDNPFKELVSLIDPSIETFRFPNFTTNHIGEKYFHYNRGTPGCCENEHIFNRKTFLTMLIIALSEKEPTTIERMEAKLAELQRVLQLQQQIKDIETQIEKF